MKKLGESDKKWYCDPRPDGVYFEEDTMEKLQGVAAAKMNCLTDMGIDTIKDILQLRNNLTAIKAALEKKIVPNGKKVVIAIGGSTSLIERCAALELQPGSPTEKNDYRSTQTPTNRSMTLIIQTLRNGLRQSGTPPTSGNFVV